MAKIAVRVTLDIPSLTESGFKKHQMIDAVHNFVEGALLSEAGHHHPDEVCHDFKLERLRVHNTDVRYPLEIR